MVTTEDLAIFYCRQYEKNTKRAKRIRRGKYSQKRITAAVRQLQSVSGKNLNDNALENYHSQVNNLYEYAIHCKEEKNLQIVQDMLIPQLIRLDLESMTPEQREGLTSDYMGRLEKVMMLKICVMPLRKVCRLYEESLIKNQIISLVPERPELEFPEVLAMERKFILHVGPTNCGKTFHALERLKTAGQGVYLGPLRLLALEVYERMKEEGVPCTMLTGEECIEEEDSRVTSSTIEMLDIEKDYDIAVIDEAQMISDSERGHCWTRAILGIRSREIHICMSPAAKKVVTHLIRLCNDTYEIKEYKRMTELACQDKPFVFPEDVRPGDALIVFSKRAVLDIAGRLERKGIRASVIYGSLPPEIRRRQIRQFASHKTKVVVSTDAIGMGLNLPVRRIVFIQTKKFDGKGTRNLNVTEVHQIAGRAGRFGIYGTGYVNAMYKDGLRLIRTLMDAEEPEIEKVSLGFPGMLLDMTEPLDTILKIWKSVNTPAPFEKVSIDEVLYLYEIALKRCDDIDGFYDKHKLYRMLTCSIDVKDKDIVSLWMFYCMTYTDHSSLYFPESHDCTGAALQRNETYYKMLDLYHQFSVRFHKEMDLERLGQAREETENAIMRYLSRDKRDYIRRCRYCGKVLPVGYQSQVCANCR